MSNYLHAQHEDKVYNIHDHHPEGNITNEDEIHQGPNLKLMPAVFASTLGIEFELPVKEASSIGINLLAKYGRFDNPRISKPVDYFKTGYRIELAYKYYFAKKGVTGLYAQAFVAYTKLVYDNGNTRPFALALRDLGVNGDPRLNTEFKLPKPYTGGIGVGYQTKIIGNRIIGNIMLGSQLCIDGNDKLFFSLYISPSVGYVF
ncbi:MAG TPA: hypothetical protein VL947_07160 [Cytophagales bacterium]|nr:hypothetical protein [Cytophagales bacterium]